MASVNTAVVRTPAPRVAGGQGSVAERTSNFEALRRCVMTCLLWENNAYDSGVKVVDRIKELVPKCDPDDVQALAVIARNDMKLRHVPLLLCRELARHGMLQSEVLSDVIQRPDEMSEFLGLLWQDGKCPIPNQAKIGLADAFGKFDEYQLGKYLGDDKSIKLRDVMQLCHPRPSNLKQSALYRSVLDGTIKSPDTWEVALSNGADKKETWTRLINERKLPANALLKNLRNMQQVGVDKDTIKSAILNMNVERILPFDFIRAVQYTPDYVPQLETAMFKSLAKFGKLAGKTVLVVDVSGSMAASMSGKGITNRLEAAAGLMMLLREMCDDISVYLTAGDDATRIHRTASIPAYRGFALQNEMQRGKTRALVGGGGIFLVQCMNYVYEKENRADRVIVITDEQDTSGTKLNLNDAKLFGTHNYVINIGSEVHGVGYAPFVHIDGFSEHVIGYIGEYERQLTNNLH